MLLRPGFTKCPVCDRFVYVTDDLFTVRNWAGTEDIPGCVPGIYHYECFRSAEFRIAYLSVNEHQMKENLAEQKQSQFLAINAADDEFALAYRPLVEEYTLYFHKLGREIRLNDRAQLEKFLDWALSGSQDDLARPDPARRSLMIFGPEEVRLEFTESLEVQAEYSWAGYLGILNWLKLGKANLVGRFVDLGRAQREAGIKPQSIACPADNAAGTVRKVESMEQLQLVRLYLSVETVKKIYLSHPELERLRAFLRRARSAITG